MKHRWQDCLGLGTRRKYDSPGDIKAERVTEW